MSILLWILGILLVLVCLYVLGLYFAIRASLRPFRIPIYLSPGSLGCPQQYVKIDSPLGYPVPGWWVEANSDIVCIHVHGYVMNRCELAPTAAWMYQRGISNLLIDLGAHGTAKRPTTGLGWPERHEIIACCEWIKQKNPNAVILLNGSSMGAAASAFAAGERPELIDGIILDSAYNSLERAISGWWSLFGPPFLGLLMRPANLMAKYLVGYNLDNAVVSKSLTKSTCPVLVLHGEADGIAFPEEAKVNIAALEDRAHVVWFPNMRHSEGRWEMPNEYFKAIETFLEKHNWLPKKSSDLPQ